MSSFTALSEQEISDILSLYDLGELKQVEQTGHGLSNTNIRVKTDRGNYLLKVSNDKSLEQIHGEQEILSKVHLMGFDKIVLPLPTRRGESVYKLAKYYGCVYPFVDGRVPEISSTTCREIASELARLHNCSLGRDLSKIRSFDQVGFGPGEMKDFATSKLCPEGFAKAWKKFAPTRLAQICQDIGAEKLPRAIVHGDLYYDNTLFKGKKLQCFLDFEQGSVGEAIMDVAISITGSCLKNNLIETSMVLEFTKAYQKVRPFTKLEKDYFFDFLKLALFSIARWRIDRFVTKQIDPSMGENYRELLDRLEPLEKLKDSLNEKI